MNKIQHRHQKVENTILSALGTPAIHRPGIMIYQRDCIEGMGLLPDGIVDLTVTSPPYNIGKEYESDLEVDEYVSWCANWIASVSRISSAQSAFWMNIGYLTMPGRAKCLPISYLLWDKVPLFLLQEIVWNYGAGVASRNYFSPRNEKFLWYVKNQDCYTFNLDDIRDKNVKYPNQKKNGKLRCNPLGKNPTDVWEFPKVTSGANRSSPERTAHPAQFPLAVIDRIVRACSNAGDVVLDPFIGSGTTAEVALSTGRFIVGFERESKYIEIIKERLSNFQNWEESVRAQLTLPVLEKHSEFTTLNFG